MDPYKSYHDSPKNQDPYTKDNDSYRYYQKPVLTHQDSFKTYQENTPKNFQDQLTVNEIITRRKKAAMQESPEKLLTRRISSDSFAEPSQASSSLVASGELNRRQDYSPTDNSPNFFFNLTYTNIT